MLTPTIQEEWPPAKKPRDMINQLYETGFVKNWRTPTTKSTREMEIYNPYRHNLGTRIQTVWHVANVRFRLTIQLSTSTVCLAIFFHVYNTDLMRKAKYWSMYRRRHQWHRAWSLSTKLNIKGVNKQKKKGMKQFVQVYDINEITLESQEKPPAVIHYKSRKALPLCTIGQPSNPFKRVSIQK